MQRALPAEEIRAGKARIQLGILRFVQMQHIRFHAFALRRTGVTDILNGFAAEIV